MPPKRARSGEAAGASPAGKKAGGAGGRKGSGGSAGGGPGGSSSRGNSADAEGAGRASSSSDFGSPAGRHSREGEDVLGDTPFKLKRESYKSAHTRVVAENDTLKDLLKSANSTLVEMAKNYKKVLAVAQAYREKDNSLLCMSQSQGMSQSMSQGMSQGGFSQGTIGDAAFDGMGGDGMGIPDSQGLGEELAGLSQISTSMFDSAAEWTNSYAQLSKQPAAAQPLLGSILEEDGEGGGGGGGGGGDDDDNGHLHAFASDVGSLPMAADSGADASGGGGGSHAAAAAAAAGGTGAMAPPAPVHVRVGVGVLVAQRGGGAHPGCVLVGRRRGSHGSGLLALPGGHLEVGESFEECAAREIQEETGLSLADVKFAGVTNDVDCGNGKHYVTVFMQATVAPDAEPALLEPHKCEGWAWTPWSELRLTASSPAGATTLFAPLRTFLRQGYSPF